MVYSYTTPKETNMIHSNEYVHVISILFTSSVTSDELAHITSVWELIVAGVDELELIALTCQN